MYKVGDIVKIRGDLMVGRCYGGCAFITSMLHMSNKKVKITKSSTNSNDIPRYMLFDNDCYWSAEMFEDNPSNKLFKLM